MNLDHPRRAIAAGVASLALVVGAGAAIAATGTDDNADVKAAAARLADKAERQSDLASRLGVTAAELEAAVENAARSRIGAAAAAGDITEAEAKALTAELDDGHLARELALPADVAEELGVTEEEVESAYEETHRAALKARVDEAVANGMITEEYAAELKQRIDEADLSDRGALGPGRPGGHHGHGFGPGLGLGSGLGLGPALEPPAADAAGEAA